MFRLLKARTVAALLFWVAAIFLWYWLYTRGAFGSAPDEHRVNLKAGSSINVPLSVSSSGDHDVEIGYSRNASDDVSKNLVGIFGKATLRSHGSIVAEAALPVDHTRSDRDGSAMVLFTLPMEPRNHYALSLEVDRIPPDLARSQAVVKTELVSYYYLLFLELELLGALLLLAGFLCVFPLIRHAWHIAHPRSRMVRVPTDPV